MRLHVWPGLDFWFYLAIISSPSWVFSFSAMDFVKKTSGLVFIFLIWTLTLLCCAGNFVLSYFYLHPQTNRFFRGYERAGKTIGFVLLVLGNVGLCYFPEKSVACILTFLFLAFYCLCALFCIQPYTGFGALEFLLTASLNPTFRRFGLPSPYSWLVIIACIVIAGIRFTLQPVHLPEQATSDEVDEGQRLRQLEGGPTDPLLEDNDPSPSDIFREPALAGGLTDPLLEEIKTYNEDPSPPGVRLDGFKEWMARVEPGVEVTFVSLPHGGNELRRIHFSRKMFNKWQAQRWWGENFDRIMELYKVQRFNQQALHTPPRSEDEHHLTWEKKIPTPSAHGLGHHYNPGSMDASRATTSSRDDTSVSISNASDTEIEWVEQAGPGVDITIRQLVDGTRELQRVRLSRERFGEMNAKTWWKENQKRIQAQYVVTSYLRFLAEDESGSSYSREKCPMTPSLNKEWTPRNYNKPSGSNGYCPTEPSDHGLGHHYNPGSMDASRATTSSRDDASVSISNASDIETEWVEEDEPGVYITIRQLADGTRELQRVRLSRERFGEMNAKTWWEENGERIQAQYVVPSYLGFLVATPQ